MCLHALGDRRENVFTNLLTDGAPLSAGPKMLPEAFHQLTEAGATMGSSDFLPGARRQLLETS